MIKINLKFVLILSILSSYIVADDFKAKEKIKPQYPKSAYVQRISGYAVIKFVINEKGRTEKHSVLTAKCFNLIDRNGNYFSMTLKKRKLIQLMIVSTLTLNL